MAARRGARPAPRQPGPRGFSLIEMALVLIVLGILTTLIMPPILASVRKEKNTQAKNALRAAKDAVIGYAMVNRALPPTLTEAGTTPDPWGRDFLYWRNENLVKGLTPSSEPICDANSTTSNVFVNLKVKGGNVDGTAFILASKGPDGVTALPTPPTAPTDLTNLGDDLVEYVTLAQLKTLVCAPARIPVGSQFGARTSANTQMVGNLKAANNAQYSVSDNVITVEHAADPTGTSSHLAICDWDKDTTGAGYGNCTKGVCTFNRTIEVYFKFRIVRGSMGGFTIAVARNNSDIPPCGQASGVYLAYAGQNGNASIPPIPEPRAGVEYDLTYDAAQDAALPAATAPRHVAPVFWGANAVSGTASTYTDDNLHGAGLGQPGYNPTGTGQYLPFLGGNLTGYLYETRIRMDRNSDGSFNTTVFVKNSNNTAFSYLNQTYPYANSTDFKARYQTTWSGTGAGSNSALMKRVLIGRTFGVTNTSPFSMQIMGYGVRFR